MSEEPTNIFENVVVGDGSVLTPDAFDRALVAAGGIWTYDIGGRPRPSRPYTPEQVDAYIDALADEKDAYEPLVEWLDVAEILSEPSPLLRLWDFGVVDRPLINALPRMSVERGGLTFRTPPTVDPLFVPKPRSHRRPSRIDRLRARARKLRSRIRYGRFGKGTCRSCGQVPKTYDADYWDDDE